MPSENYEVLESHEDQKDSPNPSSVSRNLSEEDFLSLVSEKPAISCLFFFHELFIHSFLTGQACSHVKADRHAHM